MASVCFTNGAQVIVPSKTMSFCWFTARPQRGASARDRAPEAALCRAWRRHVVACSPTGLLRCTYLGASLQNSIRIIVKL